MDTIMDRLTLSAAVAWTLALTLLLPTLARAEAPVPPVAPTEASAVEAPTGIDAAATPEVPAPLSTPVPLKPAVPVDFGGRTLAELVDEGMKAAADDNITFAERYDDVFAAGENIEVTGYVSDHVFAAGDTITIEGHVADDVFAAAGTVRVTGTIEGDLYAMAGDVIIERGATVGGKVLGAVGTLTIDGRVHGDVRAGAGTMYVRGVVGGDIDAEVGQLYVEKGAQIGGRLSYVSSAQAEVAEGASIGGGLEFEESVPKVADESDGEGAGLFFRTWGTAASLVLGSLFLWAGGPLTRRALETARDETAHRLGLGFAAFLAIPALAGVLALFILPLPVSFLLMALWFAGLWLGRVVAAGALGSYLLARAGQEEPNDYLALLLGLVVLFVVSMIPVLGFLAGTVAAMVGLGALFATAREARDARATG